jgi:DNA-binding NarL/FixJ family response regulator
MTIIIADDSSILRKSLKSLFSDCRDINIIGEAENGTDAVQIILEKKPDLAIVDVRMPELNGIEVLMKVRAKGSKTKICILTNHTYRQYREKSMAEGAFHFFDKNKDIQLMKDIIVEYAKTLNKK